MGLVHDHMLELHRLAVVDIDERVLVHRPQLLERRGIGRCADLLQGSRQRDLFVGRVEEFVPELEQLIVMSRKQGWFMYFVIFLIAELTLRLAGYGEPGGSMATPRHLAAGFDSSAEVFEPDPDHPGGWRSRYSHDRSKELVIPPKGTARRVLLFGGSNTAGFPSS